MDTDTGSTPAPTVWPTLRARDAHALIAFLTEQFGFERTAVHQDDDGLVVHAQLDWPEGGGIMLGSAARESPWALQPGTFGAYVVTDRVDALHRKLADAGVEIIRPPADTPYGSREFAVADPEGNLWSFGTYRGEPRNG